MQRFSAGRWSFLGPGSETKWYSADNERPQGERERVAELMMIKILIKRTLKSKGSGKLSIHFCAEGETIGIVFRTTISIYQLSIYGAVSDVCEEYSSCQTGRRVAAEQSDP